MFKAIQLVQQFLASGSWSFVGTLEALWPVVMAPRVTDFAFRHVAPKLSTRIPDDDRDLMLVRPNIPRTLVQVTCEEDAESKRMLVECNLVSGKTIYKELVKMDFTWLDLATKARLKDNSSGTTWWCHATFLLSPPSGWECSAPPGWAQANGGQGAGDQWRIGCLSHGKAWESESKEGESESKDGKDVA